MRLPCLLVSGVAMLALSGCHSASVDATVSNRTATPLLLIEVDYPSASFGTENLAPGSDFHYRFKILGNGPTKILYTDSAHRENHADGPELQEGQEGTFHVTIAPDGVHWQAPPAKH